MARPATDDYRRAAIALTAALRQSRPRGVVVASATPSEGATTAAIHIARYMRTDAGLNPILIELNRVRPAFQRLFALDPKRSLSRLLAEGGGVALEQVQHDPTGLALIHAGERQETGAAATSLESALCRAVQELQNSFDFILLDAPPILESADVLVAGRVIPQVLLVVGAGQVSQESLGRACQQLQDARIQVAGTILNSRKRFIPRWIESLFFN